MLIRINGLLIHLLLQITVAKVIIIVCRLGILCLGPLGIVCSRYLHICCPLYLGESIRNPLVRLLRLLEERCALRLVSLGRPVESIAQIIVCSHRERVLDERLAVLNVGLFQIILLKVPVSASYLSLLNLCKCRAGASQHKCKKKHCKESLVNPAAPHKKLQKQKEQRNTYKIHILFIIILKDHRLELLALQVFKLVDDRIEAKLLVSGTHIRPLSCCCNLRQSLLIQFCYYNIPLTILKKLAILPNRNRFALRRAHAYGKDPYTHLGSLFGSRNGVILVVLAICNEYYCPVILGLLRICIAETLNAGGYSLCHCSSLHRHRAGIYTVQKEFCRDIVCSNRELHKRLTCKDNQTYPVSSQLVHQSGDCKFCPLQPVWSIILRKHRVGDIQCNHNLCPLVPLLLKTRPYLRSCKSNYQKEPRKRKEDQPYPTLCP